MNSRLLHLFWLKWWLGLEAIITICWSPVVLQAQDSRGWYKCLQKNKFQGLINQQASTYFYYIYYLYTFSWFYNGRKEKHSFFVYKKNIYIFPIQGQKGFQNGVQRLFKCDHVNITLWRVVGFSFLSFYAPWHDRAIPLYTSDSRFKHCGSLCACKPMWIHILNRIAHDLFICLDRCLSRVSIIYYIQILNYTPF